MNARFPEPTRYRALLPCTFCGGRLEVELPVRVKPWPNPACERCLPTRPARGMRVRYDAWHFRGQHPGHQSPRLQDGAVYTIQRVLQQQHQCLVTLQETGDMTFNLLCFTPVDFQPVPGTPSSRAPSMPLD